jgi:chitinase
MQPTTMPPARPTTLAPAKPTKKPNKKQPCVNGEYYSHKDCSKYYICNNGKRTPIQCPEGTQFSTTLKTCDFEENVKCVSKKKYLRLLQSQYMRSGIFNSALLKASEGDPCDGFRYLAFPGACTNYLECVHEQLITRDCPEGLFYDPASNNCNWPDQVDCEQDSSLDSNKIDGEEEEEVEYYDDDEEAPPVNFDVEQGNFKPSTSTTTVRTSTTTRRPASTTTTKKPATSSMKPPMSSTFMTIPVPEKIQPLRGNYKLVCYFTNWAWYRPGAGKYLPDDIDENMCTHVVYGFAVLNYDELVIKPHDSWADLDNKFYERVVALKQKGVKVTLAIGGWNDSAGDKYSRLVRSAAARKKFVNHVVGFLEKYGFDGLDLDWEYPVCWQVDCKKGQPDEKENFAALVRELSEAFKPRQLLLSSAVSPSKTVIDAGYDVPTLAKYFDWIAVMCYDYHGQWDKKTGHVAPLLYHPEDEVNFFNTVSAFCHHDFP